MTSDFDTHLGDIRRTEIGAAIGATGIVGASLEPFQVQYLADLVRWVSFGSGGDVDHLRVRTLIAGELAARPWFTDLRDLYGMSLDNQLAIETLAVRLAPEQVVLSVTEGRGHSVPAIEVGHLGDWPAMDVFTLLRGSGIPAAVVDTYETLLGRLGLRRIGQVSLFFESPTAAPVFRVNLPLTLAAEDVPAFQARLGAALDLLGISVAQRNWFTAMVEAFAPRPTNRLEVTVALEPSGLTPWLRISYPAIPVRYVLKLLTQFHRAPHIGHRVGALAAAGAVGEADVLSWLHLTAHDREPPGIDFEIIAGPPAIGES